MSGKLMGKVYELKLPRSERDILLAMAENAKDDGSECFPGVAYLSWKSDYSERQVQRALRGLEEKEIIKPVNHAKGGRGLTVEYRIDITKGDKKTPYIGSKRAANQVSKGDTATPLEPERVTSETGKGDIGDVKGDTLSVKGDIPSVAHDKEPARVEPSGTVKEPSREPSLSAEPSGSRSVRTEPQYVTCQKCNGKIRVSHDSNKGGADVAPCLKCGIDVITDNRVSVDGHPDPKKLVGSVLSYYEKLFFERFDKKAQIAEGRDSGIIKGLLTKHGETEVKANLRAYILSDDDFIVKAGYSLPVFAAKFNMLSVAGNGSRAGPPSTLPPKAQKTRENLQTFRSRRST